MRLVWLQLNPQSLKFLVLHKTSRIDYCVNRTIDCRVSLNNGIHNLGGPTIIDNIVYDHGVLLRRNPEAGAISYHDPHQGLAQQPRQVSDGSDKVHQFSEDSFPEALAPRKRTRPASTIASFPGNCSTTSRCCKNITKSCVI